MVKEPAAHRKEKLFAPGRVGETAPSTRCTCRKTNGGLRRTVWDVRVSSLDILESVHLHEVVGRDMNPTGAEYFLAPGPETFPAALVHSAHQRKAKRSKR